MKRWLASRWSLCWWLLGLAGCAQLPTTVPAPEQGAWAQASMATAPAADGATGWRHHPLPGKSVTVYTPQREDGREALAVRAVSSASLMRKTVHVAPEGLGKLRFSWKVPALISTADLGTRDRSDSPVRVILAFDGDRSKLEMRDQMLSELSRAITGEEMPYATLMYVWCNKRPAETVLNNSRTGRIRKLVLESGPQHLNQWRDYERDIRADYLKAFGELPGPLIGVAVMTDTDNTRSTAQAWYGPVTLQRD